MNNEKKSFCFPSMEIIKLEDSDIITLSAGDAIVDGGDNEEIFHD